MLRLLAKAQLDTSRARSRACCRLHALARRCAWLLVAAREAGRNLPDIVPGVETWREWEKLLERVVVCRGEGAKPKGEALEVKLPPNARRVEK